MAVIAAFISLRLDGMPRVLGWRREDVRQFSNGNAFLRYRPA